MHSEAVLQLPATNRKILVVSQFLFLEISSMTTICVADNIVVVNRYTVLFNIGVRFHSNEK